MSRILVVEDESAIAELISINLRHAGFEPVFADYQSFLWNKLLGSAGNGLAARLLDVLCPVRRFASTLRLVARKVHGF